jgi:hypothetical protein
MHRYFFSTKDAFINSGSSFIDGTTFQDKNTGQDEVLELKKYYYNNKLHGFTRVLLQFDADEIESYISSSVLPSTYKLNLRLWETDGTSGLSENYTIVVNPLSESWDEGVGKEADRPKTTEGVSWDYRQNKEGAGAKEIEWLNRYPTGEDAGNASSSIVITALATSLVDGEDRELKVHVPNAVYPEQDIYTFHILASQISSQNVTASFWGPAGYGAADSGSIDEIGESLKNTINLFQHGGIFSPTIGGSNVGMTTSRTINNPYHNRLDRDGGGNVPLSASYVASTNTLIISASKKGSDYNDMFICTGSYNESSSVATFTGGQGEIINGAGGNYIRTVQASQSFSAESPDIDMDITSIVKTWFSSANKNYGLLLRLSGSSDFEGATFGNYETFTGSFEDLKFFSRQTNTIYSPKIELKWDDHLPATGSNTGSLTALDLSGTVENYVYPIHVREAYKETEKVKFRFGARKRYINKSFTTSVQNVSGSYFAEGSASYSIIDMATNETMVPFSAYTSMSCDTTSPYFMQDLNGFEPNRAYKILIKVNHNDGQKIIYDDDFEFILRV